MIKVRVMNEYQIDEMLKSDTDINYDNFYKDQLIDMLKVCRDRYKKELERKNNAKLFLCKKDMEANLTGEATFNSIKLINILDGDVDDE